MNNKYDIFQAEAYWINPDGVIYPVLKNHISFVIENHNIFGLTLQEITNIYQAEGEPLGLEGIARKEIIIALIRKGWIRIRNYPRKGWTINLRKYSQKEKSILHSWAVEMISFNLSIHEHDIVNLDLPGEVIKFELQDLTQLNQ